MHRTRNRSILFSAGIRPRENSPSKQHRTRRTRRHVMTTIANLRPGCVRYRRMRVVGRQLFGLVAPGIKWRKSQRSIAREERQRVCGADMSTKLNCSALSSLARRCARSTPGSRCYTSSMNETGYKKLVVNEDFTNYSVRLDRRAEDYGTWLQMMLTDSRCLRIRRIIVRCRRRQEAWPRVAAYLQPRKFVRATTSAKARSARPSMPVAQRLAR